MREARVYGSNREFVAGKAPNQRTCGRQVLFPDFLIWVYPRESAQIRGEKEFDLPSVGSSFQSGRPATQFAKE